MTLRVSRMPRFNPPAPGVSGAVIRTSVQVLSQGQTAEIVLDYMATAAGPVSIATVLAFLAGFKANCETAIRGVLSISTTVISRYLGAEVSQGLVPSQVLAPTAPMGTVAGGQLPGPDAVVVTKSSTLKGQHGKGRYYGPFVPLSFQDATDPNTISAAGAAAYGALNIALLLPVVAGAFTFAMAVTTRPVAPLTLVSKGIPVSTLVTEGTLGTIRRRREGRGI
jgi:hypothetical protein